MTVEVVSFQSCRVPVIFLEKNVSSVRNTHTHTQTQDVPTSQPSDRSDAQDFPHMTWLWKSWFESIAHALHKRAQIC